MKRRRQPAYEEHERALVLDLRAFRAVHEGRYHPQTIFVGYAGARAFLALLHSEGRTLGEATPHDLERLRAVLSHRKSHSAGQLMKGARFYLRYKASQGQLGAELAEAVSFERDPSSRLPRGIVRLTLSARALQALESFAEHLEVRFARRSVSSYLNALGFYLGFLVRRGVDPLKARADDVEAYQAALFALRTKQGKPYSLGSQANRLKAVKTLSQFLYRRGFILTDAAAGVDYPAGENRLPRVILTAAEMRRLLAAPRTDTAQGLRDRALLETLYATGLRASELMALATGDVELEERVVHVLLGKGRKDRNVPLTRAAAEAIEAYLLHGRPPLVRRPRRELFLSNGGSRLQFTSLRQILGAATRAGKVNKPVTCHTFRHTVATHLLKGGADIRHIQAFLGHASLATTERYTRVEISDLQKVVERAHPRGR